MDGKVYHTEYAVEVHNNKEFIRQIEVFSIYEEAEYFTENYKKPLNDGEYLSIICINYDCYGNEISTGVVW